MSLYYAALGLLFGARAVFVDRRGRTNFLYWAILISLFVFAGFRFDVGCDWRAYVLHFYFRDHPRGLELLTSREPGYWFLVSVLHDLRLPFYSLNLTMAGIFFAGFHHLARRQPDPLGFLVLSFPILVLNLPMSGIRQAAAIGLICIAYTAFIDRRPLRFLAWVAVAGLFHASALIFLPMVTFIFGGFTLRNILTGTLAALPGVYILASGDAAELAVTRYVGTDVESSGGVYRVALLALTGLAYFIYARRPWERRYPQDALAVSLGALMMILLGLVLPVSSTIADRLGYYLMPFQLMIFARFPFLVRRGSRDLVALAPYLVLAVVFVTWTQLSRHFSLCYVPYESFLLQ